MARPEDKKDKLPIIADAEDLTWAFGVVGETLQERKPSKSADISSTRLILAGATPEEMFEATSIAKEVLLQARGYPLSAEVEVPTAIAFHPDAKADILAKGWFIVRLFGDSIAKMAEKYPMTIQEYVIQATKVYDVGDVPREVAFHPAQLYLPESAGKTLKDQCGLVNENGFGRNSEVRRFIASARDLVELYHTTRPMKTPFFKGWEARTEDITSTVGACDFSVIVDQEDGKLRVKESSVDTTSKDRVIVHLLEPREAFIQRVMRRTEIQRTQAFS